MVYHLFPPRGLFKLNLGEIFKHLCQIDELFHRTGASRLNNVAIGSGSRITRAPQSDTFRCKRLY